jgi:hypothetical protein
MNMLPDSFLVYKKHYPPALKDEVWRLEKIGKDGSFHKRLNSSGIYTVEHFLQFLVRDQQKLRSVSIASLLLTMVHPLCSLVTRTILLLLSGYSADSWQ